MQTQIQIGTCFYRLSKDGRSLIKSGQLDPSDEKDAMAELLESPEVQEVREWFEQGIEQIEALEKYPDDSDPAADLESRLIQLLSLLIPDPSLTIEAANWIINSNRNDALYKAVPVFENAGYLYIPSPDGKVLIKAGKKGGKNWRESTKYTDDKGRLWIFNTTTRRWGLHPDHKKKPKKKQQQEAESLDPREDADLDFDRKLQEAKERLANYRKLLDSMSDEALQDQPVNDEHEALPPQDSAILSEFLKSDTDGYLNNIVRFTGKKSDLQTEILAQMRDLYALPMSLKFEIMRRKMKEELKGVSEIYWQARQHLVDRLNRVYQEKVSPEQAEIAALNKRVFETLHPRKLVRAPKGTTQSQYFEAVYRLAAGEKDKTLWKQFKVNRPKGYKTAAQRKQRKRK